MPPLSLDDQKLLAAHVFGQVWLDTYKIQNGETRRRRQKNLRQRALAQVVLADLRGRGENCKSCESYTSGLCEMQSDFYGDVRPHPETVCTDWTAKP